MERSLQNLWAVAASAAAVGAAAGSALGGVMVGPVGVVVSDAGAAIGAGTAGGRGGSITRDVVPVAEVRPGVAAAMEMMASPVDWAGGSGAETGHAEPVTSSGATLVAFGVLGSPLAGSGGEAPAMLRVGVREGEKVGLPFSDSVRNESGGGLARFIPAPGSGGAVCCVGMAAVRRRRSGR